MFWIVSSNMNTFMHEKTQFAKSQRGIPVYLAHPPADIPALVALGIGFIQERVFTGKLLDCSADRRQQVLQLLEFPLVSGPLTLSWITPGDSG